MKQALLDLYKERHLEFISVRNLFKNEDMAGPFLISPNNSYPNQTHRFLVIGQETNGWHYDINDLEKQMGHYETFNVAEKYHRGAFWNVTRKLEKIFLNEPFSCAWTNISKFDLKGGRLYGEYEKEVAKLDDLLIGEIKILDPEICIFFTGPNFDWRLSTIFNGIEFIEIENWNKRELCQLIHPLLPKKSFRAHHPTSLRRRGIEIEFLDYMKKVTTITPKGS